MVLDSATQRLPDRPPAAAGRGVEWGAEFTRSIVEAAPQGIIAVQQDARITAANGAAARLFGYSCDEVIGQRLELLIPEEARGRHREHWAKYLAAPYTRPMGQEMTLTGRRKDGSEFPAEVGLGCIPSAAGPLIIAFITDITARHRAIDALRKTEEDLRRYMESAPAAIATFDLEMRYLAVSRRFREDFRLGSEDLTAVCHYDTVPEVPEHWREAHRRCMAGAVEHCPPEPLTRADGTVQWVRRDIQPWHHTDGSIGGIVVFSEDVTRQKLAEEEILRLNASLEQRVSERTAELEAANQELESFSYSVSHDLRAPVRRIDAWSRALQEDYGDRLDPRAQQHLARVREEAAHLENLIDGMLRLSRVSRAEMFPEAIDLSSMIHVVCERLREHTADRELDFIVQPGLMACGDRHLLDIALTNLLSNAVKFTAPRARARIEAGRMETGPFFVRDNGVGFNMIYAANLFAAFERLHKASQFPGAGIGLATVQRVIHRHGGRVWAEAEPDKGATFYFTLGAAR